MRDPVKCYVLCVTVVNPDPVFDDMIPSFDNKKDDEDDSMMRMIVRQDHMIRLGQISRFVGFRSYHLLDDRKRGET
jgi:hypothetical protein